MTDTLTIALQIIAAIIALPAGLFLFGLAVYWFTGADVRDEHEAFRGPA